MIDPEIPPIPPPRKETVLKKFKNEIIDSREPVSDEYPYSAVLKLKVGQGHCTAFLVSPCVLVTAAHCYGDAKSKDITFASQTSSIQLPGGISIGPEKAFRPPGFSRDKDYAFIKLGENLGQERGYFTLTPATEDELAWKPLEVSGFPADLKKGQFQYSSKNSVVISKANHPLLNYTPSKNEIAYVGTTHVGMSGGPVFYFDNKGHARAVGVHTLSPHEDGNKEKVRVVEGDDNRFPDLGVRTSAFLADYKKFAQQNKCPPSKKP